MIERIASHFDWVFQMPIESQCHFAIGLSFFGFTVAAAVRETVKHRGVRYLARAIGAASFFAVAAFAHHVAHENEKLYSELMVRKGVDVKQIADQHCFVAVASEYCQTVGNTEIKITKYSGGRYSPMSITAGCWSGKDAADSSCSDSTGAVGHRELRTAGRNHGMRDEQSGVDF